MMGIKRLLQQQQLANKEKEIIRENQQVSETNISSCDQNLEVDSSTVNDRTVNEVTKDSKESNENNSSCCSQQLLGRLLLRKKIQGIALSQEIVMIENRKMRQIWVTRLFCKLLI